MAKQNHVVTLRVEIDGIKPAIWRRIAVDSDITLRALHHILQAAFGWTDAHLHEYIVEGLTYGMLDNIHVLEGADDFDQQIFDERKAKLKEIVHAGQQFTYQYDFGDSWMHIITVEKIEPRPEKMGSAWIIDGQRARPPEDVGGIYGYEDFLATIKQRPKSQEARDLLNWVGGPFEPEAFDQRMANAALLRMAWNGWGKK